MKYRNTLSLVDRIIDQHFWDYSMYSEFSDSVKYLEDHLTEEEMISALKTALQEAGPPRDDSHQGRVVMLYFLKICWRIKRERESEINDILKVNK